jgi:hypothetical protein
MTETQRLTMLKDLLDITDTSEDTSLTALLQFAMREAICWRYGYSTRPAVASLSNDKAEILIGPFLGAISPVTGTSYTFTYSESAESWQYDSADVELEDYGLSYTGTPIDAETIVVKYNEAKMAEFDTAIVQACVVGYAVKNAEGQTAHSENGISRTFKYSDVSDYIQHKVPAIVGVI